MRRGRNHFQFADNFVRKFSGARPVYKHRFPLAVTTEHHIVHNVHISHQPHAEAVFGHKRKAYAQFAYLQRRFIFQIDDFVLFKQYFPLVYEVFDLLIAHSRKIHGFAVLVAERALLGKFLHAAQRFMKKRNGLVFFGVMKNHIAALQGLKPGNRFQKFFLSAAGYARNAQNFARFRRKRYVVQYLHALVVFQIQPFYFQPVFGVDGRASFYVQRYFFTHHKFGEFVFVGVFRFYRAYGFALSQHRHAIGNRQHFVEFVRDDDNRLAVLFHLTQHGKQFFRFLRRQHGGRLVQN